MLRQKRRSCLEERETGIGSRRLIRLFWDCGGKLDARNGNAEIQLNPPNLGSLRVSVNLANGTLTAQFQSDNASVRDLLLSQMDKLKSVLEGQGLAVDKLAVGPQVNANAGGPQSVLPPQRFPDSANPDGRSGGNQGYSGRQQRWDAPRDKKFCGSLATNTRGRRLIWWHNRTRI